ncbi:hypothetical protein TRFO_27963 [Tritrichomonas foetus]|uniref:Alpha-galactosidase n=1 Tax=Tritrichomonas foetus TaxID=1144522 RepID=A0A1J4K0N4_9EUKA|nr:hypothetical protein TRFO_27963 [Tritrichomonas foetus]|eukprot:OHT04522.1 hypothetical protein TRFO_27963 [Tritrichomonas foetus]
MLSFLLFGVFSLDNGLALTPPMGWMAWEQFRCEVDCTNHPDTCISEKLFVDMIDNLVSGGWLEYGYQYINIDDCWMGPGRDENDEMYPDQSRFPHNITWLAEYAHKKGVKLGIYNDYGSLTCGGYTGSEGHLLQDAQTFAKWKVDMLKMDGCYSNLLDCGDAYPGMTHFLNKTGRQIMYQCSWPAYDMEMDYTPLPEHCNLWRNWDDIEANWRSILSIIDKWGNTPEWAQYAGPGHWNDPDQLVIGMKGGKLTEVESETQMGIWSILAAPLIMTNDLRDVPDFAKRILQNREVIAVDQDPLGIQGYRVTEWGNDKTVWVKELSNGEWAVALFNRGDVKQTITATFADFLKEGQQTNWHLRDLFLQKDLGNFEGSYTQKDIPAHGIVMLRLTAPK